jgi:hypothetical protein
MLGIHISLELRITLDQPTARPGITRKKAGRAWAYFHPKGNRITDRDEIDRLNAIALPPAYQDAWFCPSPHGHIQATGYDEGRKQYRYSQPIHVRRNRRSPIRNAPRCHQDEAPPGRPQPSPPRGRQCREQYHPLGVGPFLNSLLLPSCLAR